MAAYRVLIEATAEQDTGQLGTAMAARLLTDYCGAP